MIINNDIRCSELTLGQSKDNQFCIYQNESKGVSQGDTLEFTKIFETGSIGGSPLKLNIHENIKDISCIKPIMHSESDSEDSGDFEEWDQMDERVAYHTEESGILELNSRDIKENKNTEKVNFKENNMKFSGAKFNSAEKSSLKLSNQSFEMKNTNYEVKMQDEDCDVIIHKIPETLSWKENIFDKDNSIERSTDNPIIKAEGVQIQENFLENKNAQGKIFIINLL